MDDDRDEYKSKNKSNLRRVRGPLSELKEDDLKTKRRSHGGKRNSKRVSFSDTTTIALFVKSAKNADTSQSGGEDTVPISAPFQVAAESIEGVIDKSSDNDETIEKRFDTTIIGDTDMSESSITVEPDSPMTTNQSFHSTKYESSESPLHTIQNKTCITEVDMSDASILYDVLSQSSDQIADGAREGLSTNDFCNAESSIASDGNMAESSVLSDVFLQSINRTSSDCDESSNSGNMKWIWNKNWTHNEDRMELTTTVQGGFLFSSQESDAVVEEKNVTTGNIQDACIMKDIPNIKEEDGQQDESIDMKDEDRITNEDIRSTSLIEVESQTKSEMNIAQKDTENKNRSLESSGNDGTKMEVSYLSVQDAPDKGNEKEWSDQKRDNDSIIMINTSFYKQEPIAKEEGKLVNNISEGSRSKIDLTTEGIQNTSLLEDASKVNTTFEKQEPVTDVDMNITNICPSKKVNRSKLDITAEDIEDASIVMDQSKLASDTLNATKNVEQRINRSLRSKRGDVTTEVDLSSVGIQDEIEKKSLCSDKKDKYTSSINPSFDEQEATASEEVNFTNVSCSKRSNLCKINITTEDVGDASILEDRKKGNTTSKVNTTFDKEETVIEEDNANDVSRSKRSTRSKSNITTEVIEVDTPLKVNTTFDKLEHAVEENVNVSCSKRSNCRKMDSATEDIEDDSILDNIQKDNTNSNVNTTVDKLECVVEENINVSRSKRNNRSKINDTTEFIKDASILEDKKKVDTTSKINTTNDKQGKKKTKKGNQSKMDITAKDIEDVSIVEDESKLLSETLNITKEVEQRSNRLLRSKRGDATTEIDTSAVGMQDVTFEDEVEKKRSRRSKNINTTFDKKKPPAAAEIIVTNVSGRKRGNHSNIDIITEDIEDASIVEDESKLLSETLDVTKEVDQKNNRSLRSKRGDVTTETDRSAVGMQDVTLEDEVEKKRSRRSKNINTTFDKKEPPAAAEKIVTNVSGRKRGNRSKIDITTEVVEDGSISENKKKGNTISKVNTTFDKQGHDVEEENVTNVSSRKRGNQSKMDITAKDIDDASTVEEESKLLSETLDVTKEVDQRNNRSLRSKRGDVTTEIDTSAVGMQDVTLEEEVERKRSRRSKNINTTFDKEEPPPVAEKIVTNVSGRKRGNRSKIDITTEDIEDASIVEDESKLLSETLDVTKEVDQKNNRSLRSKRGDVTTEIDTSAVGMQDVTLEEDVEKKRSRRSKNINTTFDKEEPPAAAEKIVTNVSGRKRGNRSKIDITTEVVEDGSISENKKKDNIISKVNTTFDKQGHDVEEENVTNVSSKKRGNQSEMDIIAKDIEDASMIENKSMLLSETLNITKEIEQSNNRSLRSKRGNVTTEIDTSSVGMQDVTLEDEAEMKRSRRSNRINTTFDKQEPAAQDEIVKNVSHSKTSNCSKINITTDNNNEDFTISEDNKKDNTGSKVNTTFNKQELKVEDENVTNVSQRTNRSKIDIMTQDVEDASTIQYNAIILEDKNKVDTTSKVNINFDKQGFAVEEETVTNVSRTKSSNYSKIGIMTEDIEVDSILEDKNKNNTTSKVKTTFNKQEHDVEEENITNVSQRSNRSKIDFTTEDIEDASTIQYNVSILEDKNKDDSTSNIDTTQEKRVRKRIRKRKKKGNQSKADITTEEIEDASILEEENIDDTTSIINTTIDKQELTAEFKKNVTNVSRRKKKKSKRSKIDISTEEIEDGSILEEENNENTTSIINTTIDKQELTAEVKKNVTNDSRRKKKKNKQSKIDISTEYIVDASILEDEPEIEPGILKDKEISISKYGTKVDDPIDDCKGIEDTKINATVGRNETSWLSHGDLDEYIDSDNNFTAESESTNHNYRSISHDRNEPITDGEKLKSEITTLVNHLSVNSVTVDSFSKNKTITEKISEVINRISQMKADNISRSRNQSRNRSSFITSQNQSRNRSSFVNDIMKANQNCGSMSHERNEPITVTEKFDETIIQASVVNPDNSISSTSWLLEKTRLPMANSSQINFSIAATPNKDQEIDTSLDSNGTENVLLKKPSYERDKFPAGCDIEYEDANNIIVSFKKYRYHWFNVMFSTVGTIKDIVAERKVPEECTGEENFLYFMLKALNIPLLKKKFTTISQLDSLLHSIDKSIVKWLPVAFDTYETFYEFLGRVRFEGDKFTMRFFIESMFIVFTLVIEFDFDNEEHKCYLQLENMLDVFKGVESFLHTIKTDVRKPILAMCREISSLCQTSDESFVKELIADVNVSNVGKCYPLSRGIFNLC